jgi:hypothetical protein
MARYKFLQDENAAAGAKGNVLAGVSNIDNGSKNEIGYKLPWVKEPTQTWIDYDCSIEVFLDAGMALHKSLPQTATEADTLGSVVVSPLDINMDGSTNGVNLSSNGNYTDTVQRMATSTYVFRLRGFGLRIGYQIPIPRLVKVAGINATPAERQWAYNKAFANFGGIPVFVAEWDLWYYVSVPPKEAQLPPPNLAEHIRADAVLPDGVQVPVSQPDPNAVVALPEAQGFFVPK